MFSRDSCWKKNEQKTLTLFTSLVFVVVAEAQYTTGQNTF